MLISNLKLWNEKDKKVADERVTFAKNPKKNKAADYPQKASKTFYYSYVV